MRVARILGAVGRTLIGVGALLLLFVAYQLWGTSIQEARAQDRLGDEFAALLATTTTTTTSTPTTSSTTTSASGPAATTTTSTTSTTVAVADLPMPVEGDAVARIEIPRIGVSRYVVEGVGVADLKKGPGHYPDTPLPGQTGNAAIAGHRTTYGAPFYRLDELEPGDEIQVTTVQGEFRYVVDSTAVVKPDQVEVLDPTPDARLTITTCEPRFSARKRLVVVAVLDDEPAPTPPTTRPRSTIGDDGGRATAEDEGFEQAGLSGDPAARWPTFWWGLATAVAGLLIYAAGRRWRRLWAYPAGAPVFLALLFVFFENVSRLLPANI